MRRVRRRTIGSLVLAGVVAGCAYPTPSASPPSAHPPTLSVENNTTTSVELVVNGRAVQSVAPGVTEDPVGAQLPSLPWAIEARSPSGRALASLTVPLADIAPTFDLSGAIVGGTTRVSLPCGFLTLWVGPAQQEGPAYVPGTHDCR